MSVVESLSSTCSGCAAWLGSFAEDEVEKADARTKGEQYTAAIAAARSWQLTETSVPADALGGGARKAVGKVRDVYDDEATSQVLLVATDRLSAFDRHLATVPLKGRVLSLISSWWFRRIEEEGIVRTHLMRVPHPNIVVVRRCTVFAIEFVVRGYMTGSTSTSIWKNYEAGMRTYCGHELPDGIRKNQKLPMGAILTPTTKDEHDELISAGEAVAKGRLTQAQWDDCERAALALFAFGQRVAAQRGLILVDTKYEFGYDPETGEVVLVDEVHTPDSSRYWLARSYGERFGAGKQPENIDKEFVRLWFRERCDPYADATLPTAPAALLLELSRRYVLLYELITGLPFPFPADADKLAQDLLGGKLGDGSGTSEHWQQLLRSEWTPPTCAEA